MVQRIKYCICKHNSQNEWKPSLVLLKRDIWATLLLPFLMSWIQKSQDIFYIDKRPVSLKYCSKTCLNLRWWALLWGNWFSNVFNTFPHTHLVHEWGSFPHCYLLVWLICKYFFFPLRWSLLNLNHYQFSFIKQQHYVIMVFTEMSHSIHIC